MKGYLKGWSLIGLFFLIPGSAAAWTFHECAKTAQMDLDQFQIRRTFVTSKSTCMSAGENAVKPTLLDQDKQTIETAYPAVREFYTRHNYSKSQVAQVIALAWTEFRLKQPSDPMRSKVFQELAESFGQLTVNSDPPGASIVVDGNKWDDPTNRTDWTKAGERLVELKKTGCTNVQEKVKVLAGGSVTFERKLKCT
jgi:PEGA domain-containing protein